MKLKSRKEKLINALIIAILSSWTLAHVFNMFHNEYGYWTCIIMMVIFVIIGLTIVRKKIKTDF